jgi:hypothetical protein
MPCVDGWRAVTDGTPTLGERRVMVTDHVVMFSGGLGSWLTARRVRDEIMDPEADTMTLLFADTRMEDQDLYRFLTSAAVDIGVAELVVVAEGRDPWQVFFDERYLGNSRIDPCSKILKRQFLRRWLEKHRDPASTVVHLGIGWDESHRFEKAQRYWEPWTVRAPLCEEPYLPLSLDAYRERLQEAGIKMPRLYEMGFAHNNCGGFCVKAGKGHFRRLLEAMPERYRYHEEKEEELRQFLGKEVTILREQKDGVRRRVTLRALRERIEREGLSEEEDLDVGGCACFYPDVPSEQE